MTGLATTAAREQSECDRGTAPLFITSAQASVSSEWNAYNFCGSYTLCAAVYNFCASLGGAFNFSGAA